MLQRAIGVGVCLAGVVATEVAAQNPGTPKQVQKISEFFGNLGVPLEDEDQFGVSVTRMWDDGDKPVIAVGILRDDDGVEDAGAVLIVTLNTDGTVFSTQKISQTEGGFTGELDKNDRFSRSLAYLGDLDGDGVGDLAVAADKDDDGEKRSGAVYILFLDSDGTVKSHQKISSLEGNFTGQIDQDDQFGHALAALGDLDGDGVQDLAVGSYDDDGFEDAGAVWILFLETDGTVKSHAKISHTEGNFDALAFKDFLGWAIAPLGDFDGDHVPDLLVSNVLDDDGGNNHGSLYTVLMNRDGSVKSYQKISSTEGGFDVDFPKATHFAFSVESLGDINGDGVTDIAAGAAKDDDGGLERGAVWIFMLNPDGTVLAHEKLSDAADHFLDDQDWYGSSLCRVGDLDGDGVEELIVGARFDDDGANSAGALHIMYLNGFGGPRPDFTAAPRTGVAPLEVAFTDETVGLFDDLAWDFGDTGSSIEANPVHTYVDPGTYTVELEASGTAGTDTETKVEYVYVDRRLGCGVNPVGSLSIESGLPEGGAVYTLGVDNPLGTQAAGSLPLLYVSVGPDPLTPCGTQVPGFGMSGPGAIGELLFDLNLLAVTLPGALWQGPGQPALFPLPFPANPNLAGVDLYLQGAIYDPTFAFGVAFGLTDGLRVTIR